LYFNYKVLKPDILAKAQALQQRAMATTHEGSDSVENSTSGGVQVTKYDLLLQYLLNTVFSSLKNPN
jgi:hypothetical protein